MLIGVHTLKRSVRAEKKGKRRDRKKERNCDSELSHHPVENFIFDSHPCHQPFCFRCPCRFLSRVSPISHDHHWGSCTGCIGRTYSWVGKLRKTRTPCSVAEGSLGKCSFEGDQKVGWRAARGTVERYKKGQENRFIIHEWTGKKEMTNGYITNPWKLSER